MQRASLEDFLGFLRKNGFSPRTCIDVGAANGTYEIYRTFPKARHVLIEALEEFEPHLKALCARFDAGYWLGAAGEADGSATFNVHPDLYGSSLLAEEEGAHVDGEPRTVPVRPVDDIVAELGAGGPYLLKVDVQGGELEVLKGCRKIMEEVEVIVLETSLFNFFKNGPLLFDVMAAMDRAGFVPYDIFGHIYRLVDGALGQVDMAFVKRNGMFRTTHVYATPVQRERQNRMLVEGLGLSTAAGAAERSDTALTLFGHTSVRRRLKAPLPAEVTVEMAGPVVGRGWYNAETDPETGGAFRWMGPKPAAQVEVLVRRDCDLFVDIHVVNAVEAADREALCVEVEGRMHDTWPLAGAADVRRCLLPARTGDEEAAAPTLLTLRLPAVHAPSEGDSRSLGVAVASVRLTPVDPVLEGAEPAMADIELPAVTLAPPKREEIRAALSAYVAGIVDAVHFPTPDQFDEDRYLADHPDVAAAVAAGTFASGYEHFRLHGSAEGRSFQVRAAAGAP